MSDEHHETCVLCGGRIVGYGNNPEPLANYEDGRCCNVCNDTWVIPTRIEAIYRTVRKDRP